MGGAAAGELRRLRFGEFELRLATGELIRAGEPLALQQRPARVLETLLRRPGRTVLRREIREAVWGPEAHVDADQSINYCIRQIRLALDDSTGDPRYIQTVPRRGYRFLAPVEKVFDSAGAAGDDRSEEPGASPGLPGRAAWRDRSSPPAGRWAGRGLTVGLLFAALGIGGLLVFGEAPPDPRAGVSGAPAARPAAAGSHRAAVVVPEEAHDRYLEARYLLDRADPDEFVTVGKEAIELLDEALSEAPQFASAWTALAEAWLYRLDLPRPEAMEQANRAARTALELDPALGKAHEILATSGFFHRFDWEGTVRHLRRALEDDPGSTDALFLQALVLSAAGEHRRAIAMARRTIELDPGTLQIASLGWLYFFARRHEEAIEEADRVLDLVPGDEPSHRVKVYAALELGDEATALAELERFWRLRTGAPETADPPWDGVTEFFRQGLETAAENEDWTNPALTATFAVYAGRPEEALEPLVRACEERTGGWDVPFVRVDPRWDPLRGAPRFERLLRCVGTPAPAIGPLLRSDEVGLRARWAGTGAGTPGA